MFTTVRVSGTRLNAYWYSAWTRWLHIPKVYSWNLSCYHIKISKESSQNPTEVEQSCLISELKCEIECHEVKGNAIRHFERGLDNWNFWVSLAKMCQHCSACSVHSGSVSFFHSFISRTVSFLKSLILQCILKCCLKRKIVVSCSLEDSTQIHVRPPKCWTHAFSQLMSWCLSRMRICFLAHLAHHAWKFCIFMNTQLTFIAEWSHMQEMWRKVLDSSVYGNVLCRPKLVTQLVKSAVDSTIFVEVEENCWECQPWERPTQSSFFAREPAYQIFTQKRAWPCKAMLFASRLILLWITVVICRTYIYTLNGQLKLALLCRQRHAHATEWCA